MFVMRTTFHCTKQCSIKQSEHYREQGNRPFDGNRPTNLLLCSCCFCNRFYPSFLMPLSQMLRRQVCKNQPYPRKLHLVGYSVSFTRSSMNFCTCEVIFILLEKLKHKLCHHKVEKTWFLCAGMVDFCRLGHICIQLIDLQKSHENPFILAFRKI